METYLATPRQEGAPRDPAQGPPRRSGRRDPPRDSPDPLADLEAFIDLHQKRWGADGLFPPTRRAAPRAGSSSAGCSSCSAPDGALQMCFLSVGERRIAAGVHFETAGRVLYYNAGVDPDARELSPGVLLVYAYIARALASAARRRFDFLRGNEPYKYEWGAVDEPSSASWSAGVTADDERPVGRPIPASRSSSARRSAAAAIRVVELLATGTNGGAQEHLYSLVTRIDHDALRRLDRRRSRRAAPSASSSRRAPGPRHRRAGRRDRRRCARRVPRRGAARGLHDHMYRAETVGTRAAIALAEVGQRRPYVVSTVHSSRIRSEEDRELLRDLTPHMDQLIAVSQDDRAQARRRRPRRRARSSASTTASTCRATTTRRRAARSPRSTASSRARSSSASSRGSSPRRATRPCSRPGHGPRARSRTPTCSSSARARGARRSRRRPASCGDRPPRSSSPAAATTSRP